MSHLNYFAVGICIGLVMAWLRVRIGDYVERRERDLDDGRKPVAFLRWALWETDYFLRPLNLIAYDLMTMARCHRCKLRRPSSTNAVARWNDLCDECYFVGLLEDTRGRGGGEP
jgi:hypothetical protein